MLNAARLWQLLGQPGGTTDRARGDPGAGVELGAHRLHRFILTIGSTQIPAIYLRPTGAGPYPAVLYCHAHGNRYEIGAEELVLGRPALHGPYGPALADLGVASLAIDLAPFGGRQDEGPEAALVKAALWQGRPLMGRMLADLHAAFRWLEARPEVDAARIATLGLSMGGTHAYWLAALEPRIAACAHLCVLGDMAPLIATGAHDLHGPYMTVPGLLTEGDMGDVAALVAPRPHFVALGQTDPLTPPEAYDPAVARLTQAYANAPDRLHLHLSPRTGHVETPEMRHEALAFLARHLVG
ncbi:alpha/beta hydrolase family protein [Roseicyclus marinus]|uniref:alpha/beta hydrolase family protein n=1 Tax=Roseicyclus marinus TaxID=2161673 RepID=UPI00240E9F1E|nr:dienelactone hydrolase family protein [Roseicyclus marinus]MDG3040700.1 dienelactone hydrolase family protein [Roseicyclus marinus]